MSHEQDMRAALDHIAHAIARLGNADAATPMGGLEAHGAVMLQAAQLIADGLHDVADAIRDQGTEA